MATFRPLLITLGLMSLVLTTSSDLAADRAECTDQLMGLATCITYVQGTTNAKNPTPDCCAGFKQVVQKSLRCVCILVKDHDDPNLGLNLNVTLALQLPHKCNAPTNISDCPSLLKLPKDSAETKMFEGFARELEGNSTSTSTPKTSTGSDKGKASSDSAGTTSTQAANSAERIELFGFRSLMRVSGMFPLVLPLLYLFLV